MNENDVDEICAEKTNSMKNKKFLEKLQCCGPKAFETLIKALKVSIMYLHYVHVVCM